MAHNTLLHDVLQEEEVMIVSASLHTSEKKSYGLRCRQKIAVEHAGRCFCIAALYDWGASTSVITRAAAAALKLSPTRYDLRMIQGLGGKMIQYKSMYAVPLVARNGDIKTVSAWEVKEIATLPVGYPPSNLDEHFPGLRYLTEPECLFQKGGTVELLIGMDHSHLMPEHVGESSKLTSHLDHEVGVWQSLYPGGGRCAKTLMV
jgi:hypothetical protein